MIKRVMLATAVKSMDDIQFPVLASVKLDGVRAVVTGGRLLSRSMKPIPNRYINEELQPIEELEGLDGELIVGPPHAKDVYNKTVSGVMSRDGEPDFTWYVFDYAEDGVYWDRHEHIVNIVGTEGHSHSRIVLLKQMSVRNKYELQRLEELVLEAGFEGLILRSEWAPYKQGRSTIKQGYLLKLKRFHDAEAEVLGCVEQMHNENEATLDERGYTKRSTHKAGKVQAGVLGALQVRDIESGVEFEIGTGFTAEQRKNLWDGREYLPGKIVKYKHFPVGVKDKPRFPTFLGFRDRRDM